MSIRSDSSVYADPHAEINVTPLIDVMLALVVVFMIAMPILTKRIALPMSEAAWTQMAEPVHLGIRADGSLSWNEVSLLPALLPEQLRILAHRVPQPPLIVDVASSATYGSLATALAEAKAAKVDSISIERAP